eukprot:361945-Chlamydomonas_euryale.AAC.3
MDVEDGYGQPLNARIRNTIFLQGAPTHAPGGVRGGVLSSNASANSMHLMYSTPPPHPPTPAPVQCLRIRGGRKVHTSPTTTNTHTHTIKTTLCYPSHLFNRMPAAGLPARPGAGGGEGPQRDERGRSQREGQRARRRGARQDGGGGDDRGGAGKTPSLFQRGTVDGGNYGKWGMAGNGEWRGKGQNDGKGVNNVIGWDRGRISSAVLHATAVLRATAVQHATVVLRATAGAQHDEDTNCDSSGVGIGNTCTAGI